MLAAPNVILDDRTAVAVFGKSQGTKPENLQLRARVGVAAALWHATPASARPFVLYVPADIGRQGAPDAAVVESLLVERWRVPADRVVVRRISRCTFVEVRALRDLCSELGVTRIVAVTHGYHAARARSYLREVFDDSEVVAAERAADAAPLFADLPALIDSSRPRGLDLARERCVEATLRLIHALDPAGRLERRLADHVRPPYRVPRSGRSRTVPPSSDRSSETRSGPGP